MKMPKPKFEKVDDYTIKIIIEKASDVPLSQIIENKKHVLEQKRAIEQALKNINEILEEAKRLGITVKEEQLPKETRESVVATGKPKELETKKIKETE